MSGHCTFSRDQGWRAAPPVLRDCRPPGAACQAWRRGSRRHRRRSRSARGAREAHHLRLYARPPSSVRASTAVLPLPQAPRQAQPQGRGVQRPNTPREDARRLPARLTFASPGPCGGAAGRSDLRRHAFSLPLAVTPLASRLEAARGHCRGGIRDAGAEAADVASDQTAMAAAETSIVSSLHTLTPSSGRPDLADAPLRVREQANVSGKPFRMQSRRVPLSRAPDANPWTSASLEQLLCILHELGG